MSKKITAVIEIGSNMLVFKAAQKKNNQIEILEEVEYPLSLGRDTFSKGKIGFDKIEKTCEIIKSFVELASGYGIEKENISVFATTAVREAKNRYYILDQLKVKTGMDIKVIDDSEEKLYNYKNIFREISKHEEIINETALVAYISSGSLGVALYKKEKIIYNQNILIGSLKLSEILGDIKYNTDKLYIMIDDYLSSFTLMLMKMLPVKDIKYFIVSGRGMKLIANECGVESVNGSYTIDKTQFYNFYDKVKSKIPEELVKMYKISEEKAEILLPSLGIYKALWDLTSAGQILSPEVEFSDSVIYDILFEKEKNDLKEKIYKSAIATAKKIGERYLYDENHAKFVENISLKIFDKLKKIHGLSEKERLLLQISSILHDIGKFVNIKNHYKHSYNMIKGIDIIGLNQREIDIVANLALYHSRELPSIDDKEYRRMSIEDRVLTSKLLAILRIADALDRSHQQKIKEFEIEFKENQLIIIVKIEDNILIDEWTFIKKSTFLTEVFGIKALIKKKIIT